MKGANKKAQAAIEYLVTYGWVFVVIIGAIAALSYFDILDPSQYVSVECDFGQQLQCVDQYMDTDEKLILRFKNLFGADMEIVNASIFDSTSETMVTLPTGPVSGGVSPVPINVNEIGRVEINASSVATWLEGSKERVRLVLEFRRVGGTRSYNLSGKIVGEVTEPLAIT